MPNIERAVRDAEDVAVVLDQVCDAVMPVQKDSDVAGRCPVAMPYLGMLRQNLSLLVDAKDGPRASFEILCGDKLENVLEPALRLKRLLSP
jgi:hypothetical protein